MFAVKDVVVQAAHVWGGGSTRRGGAEKQRSCILRLYFQIHSRVSHL